MIDALEILNPLKHNNKQTTENQKKKGLSPFDIVSNINKKDGILDDDEIQENYSSYIINKILSGSLDTVLLANEINAFPNLDKGMQYHFYYFAVDKYPKRFIEWKKAEQHDDDVLKVICEIYNYSRAKAKDVLPILQDKLEVLFDLKGGRRNEKQKYS